MTNDKKVKINQIDLICSIMNEIDKQNKGCLVSQYQTSTIIQAANLICDAFNKDNDSKTE